MKKVTRIFAIICIIVMMIPMMVQAVEVRSDNIDDIAKARYGAIDELSSESQKAAEWYEDQGLNLVWAIYSLQHHQWLQTRFYEKDSQNSETVIKAIMDDEDTDFVQFGTLKESGVALGLQKELEEHAGTAALDFLLTTTEQKEKLRDFIIKNNLPIWWKIEPYADDQYTVEVAVGKYEIKWGDTLSEIALTYNTTVERLLYLNKNIEDPNMIYAGDYLVIK